MSTGKTPKRSGKRREAERRRKIDTLFSAPPQSPSIPVIGQGSSTTAAETQRRADYLLQLGIEALQTRRIDDAAGYLTKALELSPTSAAAHHCLGIVHRARGNLVAAAACYQQALVLAPQYAEAHNNLGIVCEARGKLSDAVACFESALRCKPDFVAAMNNLANVLIKLEEFGRAITHLTRAVQLQPNFAAAYNSLGIAHGRLKQLVEAEQHLRRGIQLQPVFPEAYANLGNALRGSGDSHAARECYKLALDQRPQYSPALIGVGNLLLDDMHYTDALQVFNNATVADPGNPEAHFGRGSALMELGQLTEAETALKQAIVLQPRYARALNNLGNVFRRQDNSPAAEAAFKEAVNCNDELWEAHNNLANLYRVQDRMDLAAVSYRRLLARHRRHELSQLRLSTLCPAVFSSRAEMDEHAADSFAVWKSSPKICKYQDLPDLIEQANEPAYNLQFFAENIRPLKEAYANVFEYTGHEYRPHQRQGRIHVGCMVSLGHEMAFMRHIWSALHRMNREEFQLTVACAHESADKFRQAINDHDVSVVPIPAQLNRVVPTLARQRFDIMYYFEIGTDALNYFLPFFRLAPTQVTSWGIQVTSGIQTIDAYLSSSLVESRAAQDHYSERLILADTLLSYQVPMLCPENPRSREAFGFSDSDNLYLCLQHVGKFHPDFDVVMAELLRRDPQGLVVAVQDKYGYGAERLRQRWERAIGDIADRIVMLPRMNQANYLSLLAAGNVMVDPIHFGGVTTTYDGLSLGVPIVTLPSSQHRGRYTAACLTKIDQQACIARDVEDYVNIASEIGMHRDRQAAISAEIKDKSWRMFEDHEAVREHERIFKELVKDKE